jgi:hypothetical protein
VATHRTVTRWVTPEGARLALVYLTHTSRHRDGWHLVVTHPAGSVLADWHFGRAVDEAALAAALAAVNAIPELPTTKGTTQ